MKKTFLAITALAVALAVGCVGNVQEPEMTLVEGGTFIMGCTPEQGGNCEDYELPVRNVTLSDFYIGKYEVTQGLWRTVVGDKDAPSSVVIPPHKRKDADKLWKAATLSGSPSFFTGDDSLPVETVDWDDVQCFIDKLNRKTRMYYRLPTEAEWEFAARGGNKSRGYRYSGGDSIDGVAWYEDNSGGETHPVGLKQPNELGLYDMSGNVLEWVGDWYAPYPRFAQANPTGPLLNPRSTGHARALRGGAFSFAANGCRVSYRTCEYPSNNFNNVGFRLAVSVNAEKRSAISKTDILIWQREIFKWTMAVLNVLVLIYLATTIMDIAEKRMDDIAGKRMDSVVEKRADDTAPDTVVMKYSLWYLLTGLLTCIATMNICFMEREWNWINVLFYEAYGIFLLLSPLVRKTVLDGDGITVKYNLVFLGFTVYDKSTLTRWCEISRVNAFWFNIGFGFSKNISEETRQTFGIGIPIPMDFSQTDYKKGLEYAVRKLPSDVFTKSARQKLKNIGIWHAEW